MNPTYVKFYQAVDLGQRNGLTTYWAAVHPELGAWQARMNAVGIVFERNNEAVFVSNANVCFAKGSVEQKELKAAKKQ